MILMPHAVRPSTPSASMVKKVLLRTVTWYRVRFLDCCIQTMPGLPWKLYGPPPISLLPWYAMSHQLAGTQRAQPAVPLRHPGLLTVMPLGTLVACRFTT